MNNISDKLPKYDISAAFARRDEITKKLHELAKEKNELDVTIRVLERFSPYARGTKMGPERPKEAPTLFEMTESVLREAIQSGKPGLCAKDLVKEIGDKHWPGVKFQQIMPSIYQFAKKKRISKNPQGLFSLNGRLEERSDEISLQSGGQPDTKAPQRPVQPHEPEDTQS